MVVRFYTGHLPLLVLRLTSCPPPLRQFCIAVGIAGPGRVSSVSQWAALGLNRELASEMSERRPEDMPKKLHQHRPQTATNHVSTTFMRNKEFIGCPIPEKRNERKEGRQTPEPQPGPRRSQKITMEHNPLPGHVDGTECQKTRETIPGTLAGTRK